MHARNESWFQLSEASLHQLIEANADGIIIVDQFGSVRFANPAAANLFAQPLESLINTPFGFPVVAGETAEIDIVRVNSNNAIAEMRVVAINWQGQPAYLASLRDITERKQAETALRTREQFLALLNNITHAALKTDETQAMLQMLADRLGELFNADGCYITLWDENQQAARPSAAYGPLRDQYPTLSPLPDLSTITESVLSSGEALAINNVVNSPYAKTRTAYLSSAHSLLGLPLISNNQKLGAVLITFTYPHHFSVDEIQHGEQVARHIALALAKTRLYEQVQSHAKNLEFLVARRTQELQDAYERLQEMEHLKSNLIDHISHELRTPTANLRLYLNLLANGPPEKHSSYMEILHQQVGRLMKLIEGIIQLTQLDLLSDRKEFTAIDLNKIANMVVENKRQTSSRDGVELMFVKHTTPLFVLGDQRQLIRMISSLVSNAIQYTLEGEISVALFADEQQKHVCLQVKDTGIGIASEDMPYIFEEFYRGLTVSQSNLPGIGLGLTIVKRIVDAHKGDIDVQSQSGEGTSVLIRLPSNVLN